jgi:hypothetical protein
MKKIGLILAAVALFATTSFSQVTAPRFGTDSRSDNTGRVLTYAIITTTDVTSATLDTITIRPNAYTTLVCMKTGTAMTHLTDSVCYKFSSTNSYYKLGDKVEFYITKGTGAGKIKFGGSQFILSTASAAVAVAADKTLIMGFVFNGRKWVEAYRMIQP